MSLRRTNTNAADDSQGFIMGFEGNDIIIIVVALVVGMIFSIVLFSAGMSPFIVFLAMLMPAAAASYYIGALKKGKPPHYDMDLLETLVVGKYWTASRKKMIHPFKRDLSAPTEGFFDFLFKPSPPKAKMSGEANGGEPPPGNAGR